VTTNIIVCGGRGGGAWRATATTNVIIDGGTWRTERVVISGGGHQ